MDESPLQPSSSSTDSDEIPNFPSLKEYKQWADTESRKKYVALDQAKYNIDRYADKRKELAEKIHSLIDGLSDVLIPADQRVAYANLVNLLICYKELFFTVVGTMERNYKYRYHSFASCDVMDSLEEFFTIISNCKKEGSTKEINFANLLNIRDKVVSSLRDHYLIALPMKKNKKVVYRTEMTENYQPFDYEWMSGTVLPDKNPLPYTMFIASSRRNQVELSTYRASLVITQENPNFNFIRNMTCPFPFDPKNAETLELSIPDRIRRTRQDFVRLYRIAKKDAKEGSKELLFATQLEQFNELSEMMRLKKNHLLDTITNCTPSLLKTKLRKMETLATIESMMLVLSRVFALHYDSVRGLYGEAVPDRVLIALRNVVRFTSEQQCTAKRIDGEIKKKLLILRREISRAIEMFYIKKESSIHDHHNEAVDVPKMEMFDYEMNIRAELFDASLGKHKDRILWHLAVQRLEVCRIARELHYAREVPKQMNDNSEKFRINDCKGTNAFFCNAHKLIDRSKLSDIKIEAMRNQGFEDPKDYYGTQLYLEMKYLAEKYEMLPMDVGLNLIMGKELEKALGTREVHGDSTSTLVKKLIHQMNLCVDAHGLSSKFRRMISRPICEHAAKRIIYFYMEYLRDVMKESPMKVDPTPFNPDFKERISKGRCEGAKSLYYVDGEDTVKQMRNLDGLFNAHLFDQIMAEHVPIGQ